jgi:hypothetical protein
MRLKERQDADRRASVLCPDTIFVAISRSDSPSVMRVATFGDHPSYEGDRPADHFLSDQLAGGFLS